MMETPAVSIIIPIYKVPEKYLRACIESCQKQTLKDIEIILVDDGSPDCCGEICDAYATNDKRIHVIHKKNGGLSAARNTGFLAATGTWIMFVDGDDWIESNTCEYMYQKGKLENVQLIMCGIVREYPHSSYRFKFYIEEKVYKNEECKWLQQQILAFNGNISAVYAKLIRRDFLNENHILHDEQLRQGAEGLEFNLRLFEMLSSAVFVNKPFYHYLYNETSISSSTDERNNEYVLSGFEKMQDFINHTSKNKEALLPYFNKRLLYVICTTAISGYFNPANPEPYREKKRKLLNYCQKLIVARALETKNMVGISRQRKVVLYLIKHHMFFALNLLGIIRKKQKQLR